jgi:hypothetical protein
MRMESLVPCAAHKHLREHQGAPGLLVRPVRTRWWPGGQRTPHPCAPGRHAGKESPAPAPLRTWSLVFVVDKAPKMLNPSSPPKAYVCWCSPRVAGGGEVPDKALGRSSA